MALRPRLVRGHVGKVAVFHILVQFEIFHPILEQLVIVLQLPLVVHEQLVVLKLIVQFLVERWELRESIYV